MAAPFSLSGFVQMGNAQSFSFTPNPTILPHINKQNGIRQVDNLAVTQYQAEVEIQCDEFIEDNLLLAFFGVKVSSGEIEIGNAAAPIEREVAFVGSNTYGANLIILLDKVAFHANKVIEFIAGGDAWGEINLTGQLLLNTVTGYYGRVWMGSAANGAPVAAGSPTNDYYGMGTVYTAPIGTV